MSTLLGAALCELSAYAGDSFKIPPAAHDPCWAMQRLGLRWLKDQHRRAKHGVVFDDWELLDTESNHVAEAPNTLIWWQLVVSMELCWSIQDNLCSCVHLEEITPTRTQTFVGRRWKKSEVFKMALKKCEPLHLQDLSIVIIFIVYVWVYVCVANREAEFMVY